MKSRIGVEQMEGRVVPAAFYWEPLEGSDLLASTATNWVDANGLRMTTEVPDGDDDLYFTAVSITTTTTPTGITTASLIGGDPGGPPGTSPPPPPSSLGNPLANCFITSSDSTQSVVRTYNGVHLMDGYTGTVDFQVSTFVGTLELHDGSISQNDAF